MIFVVQSLLGSLFLAMHTSSDAQPRAVRAYNDTV